MGTTNIKVLLSVMLIIGLVFGLHKPALATGAKIGFTATVAKVENGIGIAGDRSVTKTLREIAAVSFIVTNPSDRPQKIKLATFDAHFHAVDDIKLVSDIVLPAGATKRIFAYVPVSPNENRRFRICAKGIQGTHCGKFIAQKLP
ncbi:MAG: hypothetical protein AAFR71_13315 [Pseudomonadota bacterium]